MSAYISSNLRFLVAERADFRGEYCRIHERDLHFIFQIDHIVSLKHGGLTVASNLAFACIFCNLHKGTDLATFLESRRLVRLFDPRNDRWNNHFRAENGEISGRSKIGEATIKLLDMNQPDRLILRRLLMEIGAWP